MQAIVLMLFNDAAVLKYIDIKEASGIDDVELRRVLQSLALGKTRVLVKEPKVLFNSLAWQLLFRSSKSCFEGTSTHLRNALCASLYIIM